jgi:hypothetical protein
MAKDGHAARIVTISLLILSMCCHHPGIAGLMTFECQDFGLFTDEGVERDGALVPG